MPSISFPVDLPVLCDKSRELIKRRPKGKLKGVGGRCRQVEKEQEEEWRQQHSNPRRSTDVRTRNKLGIMLVG